MADTRGWTKTSHKKAYGTLVKGKKGKKGEFTQCMNKMKGKVDDPAAYCMSLKVKGGIPTSEVAAEAVVEGVPIGDVLAYMAHEQLHEKSVKMPANIKRKINKLCHTLGLDYFISAGMALSPIEDELRKYGYHLQQSYLSGAGKKGSTRIEIMKLPDDWSTNPDAVGQVVGNTMLAYSWHRMPSGKFAITSYLS